MLQRVMGGNENGWADVSFLRACGTRGDSGCAGKRGAEATHVAGQTHLRHSGCDCTLAVVETRGYTRMIVYLSHVIEMLRIALPVAEELLLAC